MQPTRHRKQPRAIDETVFRGKGKMCFIYCMLIKVYENALRILYVDKGIREITCRADERNESEGDAGLRLFETSLCNSKLSRKGIFPIIIGGISTEYRKSGRAFMQPRIAECDRGKALMKFHLKPNRHQWGCHASSVTPPRVLYLNVKIVILFVIIHIEKDR